MSIAFLQALLPATVPLRYNAYKPSPGLLAYAATKGAIQNFTAALGQLWAENAYVYIVWRPVLFGRR